MWVRVDYRGCAVRPEPDEPPPPPELEPPPDPEPDDPDDEFPPTVYPWREVVPDDFVDPVPLPDVAASRLELTRVYPTP
jgi:hypothetical protein